MNPTQNTLVRLKISKTDDSGKQQVHTASGRKREGMGTAQVGIPRIGFHGFAYHPHPGSHAIALMMNGDPDQALLLGAEHADHRPKGLKPGESKQYGPDEPNQHGYFKDDGSYFLKAGGCSIEMKGGKIILTGDVYLGGADADRAVSAINTVDTAGDLEVSNLLTKVWGK